MSVKIITEYWPKPIPFRGADWIATTDDYDGAPDAGRQFMGFGRTEAEAIAQLTEEITEAQVEAAPEPEPERCRDCGALTADGISIDERACFFCKGD